MKKKNFRTLKAPPQSAARTETTIKCAACGLSIKLMGNAEDKKAELKKLRWYLIGDQLHFCPNCDVLVVENKC